MIEVSINWTEGDDQAEAWDVSWAYDSPELNCPDVDVRTEHVVVPLCRLRVEERRWVFVNVFALRGQHVSLSSETMGFYVGRW